MAGSTDGHHSLTHDEPGEQPQVNAIVKELMGMVRRQLEALDAVEEGWHALTTALCSAPEASGRTHSWMTSRSSWPELQRLSEDGHALALRGE